jgi:oxygen-independent coproporphyrinogen-3 oxidase
VKGVQPYIEYTKTKLPRLEENAVPEYEAMEDFMMVGLRLLKGVRASDYAAQFEGRKLEDKFGSIIEKLEKNGLLERIEDAGDTVYKLTDKGVLFGNDVFGSFIGLEEEVAG